MMFVFGQRINRTAIDNILIDIKLVLISYNGLGEC